MFLHRYNNNLLKRVVSMILVLIATVSFAATGHAATLGVAPVSTKVSVGNIVSVKVVVSTLGKSINNAEATIAFPSDLLEVLSISKSSSVFSLWVEEPKFTNYDGKITFNGGVPNPGYVGDGGEVASITFKAKKSGTASIVFVDGAVRENNGLGTDILTSKGGGTIVVESAAQLEVPAVTTSANTVPGKPIIVSSTHPKQDAWYSNPNASFSWVIPPGVTSIQTLLGKTPDSIPTVTYDSSVSQRTVNNLTEGVFYFHLRYMNQVGWGTTAHYKIQVDTTPPDKFSVQMKEKDGRNVAVLNATDALSGIDAYSIKVDNRTPFRVRKDMLVNNEYVLPVQNQGDHELVVTAYDKAGNMSESSTVFSSGKISAPSLKIDPDHVVKGDTIRAYGTTKYPQSGIVVTVKPTDGELRTYAATTTDEGAFSVTVDGFTALGTEIVSAQLVFSDEVRSPESNKVTVKVVDTALVSTTKSISYALLASIAILILVLIMIYTAYLGWHRFFGLKRRLARDLDDTVIGIHRSLMSFKTELSRQLNILEETKEDRELNKKEEKIFKELQESIDTIDTFIEKKLKNIK